MTLDKKNKSFTLIELLVVISIIGLISSLVLVNINLPAQRQRAKIAKTLEFSHSIQNSLGAEALGIWSFDNNTYDTSGYGNNGTINGGATFTDDTPQKVVGSSPGKYALSFNGSTGYVGLSSTISFANGVAWTAEIWAYPVVNTYWQILFSGTDYYSSWILLHDTNKLSFRSSGGTPFYTYWTVGDSRNNWHHIVLVAYGDSTIRLYYDGVDKGLQTPPHTAMVFKYIGATTAGAYYFNGSLDEVRIYSQALTIGQIQKHYAEGLENHKNLTIR